MMRRNEKKRKVKSKQIVAAGIVSLTVVLTASAGISYADMDIAGAMASWFNKKTEQVIQGLDQSMKSETDAQKELLKKELQLRLEASTRSLQSFTDTQKQLHLQALEQHAQYLLAGTEVKTEQDRKQILDKLQTILDSAKDAMDSLAGSYVPPAMVFTQSPPIILVAPPPSAPAIPPATPPAAPPSVPPASQSEIQPPTVISDVYGQQR
ncbi:hypothetical protein [Paenibacillus anseongense]|uniref:hypothetical protein n=1 Tax=Paenibacillus TaxID=44249 RepID=UPI002DBA8B04|nr:hypothetical protein [Paenibacillus anseongense]MEC0268832.1 hypothetical protein [Paenibacillus anseongense]